MLSIPADALVARSTQMVFNTLFYTSASALPALILLLSSLRRFVLMVIHKRSLVAGALLLDTIVYSQSFQYVTNSSLPGTSLTEDCSMALLSNISCNPWVRGFRPGQYYNVEGLQAVCTSGCQTAIEDWQSTLASSCSDLMYNYTDTTSMPISAIGSQLLDYYNLACLQDGERFCNNVAYEKSLQNDPDAEALLGEQRY